MNKKLAKFETSNRYNFRALDNLMPVELTIRIHVTEEGDLLRVGLIGLIGNLHSIEKKLNFETYE